MSKNQLLHQVVSRMGDARVLVVGDVMLDVYERCAVKRISPEAPVPVAVVIEDSSFLGGAGNVANNVRALGSTVSVVGLVGDDREGETVRKTFEEKGIDHRGLVVDTLRPTTLKKRVVSETQQLMRIGRRGQERRQEDIRGMFSQQLIRIDREVTEDIGNKTEEDVCGALEMLIPEHDVVVVSDYCKGLLTENVIRFIKDEAKRWQKKVFVDSKSRHLSRYSGVHLIKPNKVETETFAGEVFTADYANLEAVGKRVSESLASSLVVTLGGDGMAMFEIDKFAHKRTLAQDVFDVSGAGDTVLSVIATAVAVGADLESAVDLSNHAAGYVVSQLGTIVCDQETLRGMIDAPV